MAGRSRYSPFGPRSVENVGTIAIPLPSSQMLFKFLADSTGGVDMTTSSGNTTAPSVFTYTVGTGKIAYLSRLNINIMDASIDPGDFGGIGALTNGVVFETFDTNTTSQILDFTDGQPVKHNGQWGSLAGTDAAVADTAGGANDDRLNIRWTLTRAGASPIMTSGHAFRAKIQDDVSGLTEFRCMLQGILLDSS